MIFDNMSMAGLFTLTCGSLHGLNLHFPPHHIEAYSKRQGKKLDESWEPNPQQPKALSRSLAFAPPSVPGLGLVYLQ